MDIVINNYLTPVSIIAICIIIGTLVLAYVKKIMMTYALIIANFIVFILTIIFQEDIIGKILVLGDKIIISIAGLGFRPIYLSQEFFFQLYTLFTSMFIHGGFLHIFGNMFVFLFMGIAFEDRVGWKNFLTIYFITGVCGTLTHSLLNLGSPITLIGASGAIFGILGSFAYSFPRDEVVMPIPVGIMFITRIKVIYAALLFAVMETVIVMFGVEDSTAHFAHLGGLVSGVVLAALLIGNQGKKTKQPTTIYHDISQVPKSQQIDFPNLRKLATTPELRDELQRIENETVLEVRDAWLDHFLDKIVCPKCNRSLKHSDGKIWCEENHFRTKY
ncbi:MAG: rhomboid family intramembrane serine protease [Petrotogales bacterium]